ncbi:hypothetical protein JOE11_004923 [Robbsia andropogonis]
MLTNQRTHPNVIFLVFAKGGIMSLAIGAR